MQFNFFCKRASGDSRPEASIGDMSTDVLFDGDSSVPKSRMTFILFIILKPKVVLWIVCLK